MIKKLSLVLIALAATLVVVAGNANIHHPSSNTYHPFPLLGGELSNSAATSVADIDEVLPRMRALGLNTVLVPAYWELMEPVEGEFDFTLIDRIIDVARHEQLRVVFLWFGVWKNSMSCYAPSWFKQDTKRFPRAMTASGKPLEIASCFSPDVLQADLKAFSALMRRIKEQDPQREVVVMIQIENEIGMLESARDHSPLAEKVYRQERWAERYGTDETADEKFMALSYARYVEHLAKAARQIHDMPLYVNAAMNSRGRRPGEYPSAGPLAHLIDFWREGAPSIDLLAPDIYDTGFKSWAAQYAMPLRPQDGGKIKNRLFVPESRCCENSGVRALYVFGEHQALGFSPFAIDQASEKETESVTKAYGLMTQLVNGSSLSSAKKLINWSFSSFAKKSSWGLLFDQDDRERIINDNGVVMTCRHYFTLPWDSRATDGSTWPEGGAVLIRLDKFDYLLAGSGVVIDFKTSEEKQQEEQKQLGEDGFAEAGSDSSKFKSLKVQKFKSSKFRGSRLGLLSVDEVTIGEDGKMEYVRRHNGDQSHQGRHARISVGEWKILHIRLYEY
ncbi:MAG: DUF5597 domain-containing protein [Prevotella sp.]|nr:DUF5597 domain-containing protein [Prevotella sp.]